MLKFAFLNLFRRKGRTALSLLGIVIGVTAIIGMVSVVDGMQQEFDTAIANIQAVLVIEEGSIDQTLSVIDASYADEVRNLPYVRTVVSEIWRIPAEIDGKANAIGLTTASVYGIETREYTKLKASPYSVTLSEGSFLEPGDTQVVIGEALAKDMKKFVGNTIKLNDTTYTIRGIYTSNTEFFEYLIVMDLEAARELFSFENNKISTLYVEPLTSDLDTTVRDLIAFRFDDLDVMTSGDFSAQIGDVLGSFRLVVLLVAGISALVAGIGILNTILMSVFERKREIGVLKAMGWTRLRIIQMIFFESLLLGVIGGIIGVLFGLIVAFLVTAATGIGTAVTPLLLAQAFIFAVLLGIAAGLYPALHASQLNPVDALRGS